MCLRGSTVPFKRMSPLPGLYLARRCLNFEYYKVDPYLGWCHSLTLSEPTGYVMHQQFNIQQLYALLTLYLCVLYLSENKQRLVPLTA